MPYRVIIVNNSPEEKDIHTSANDQVSVIESGCNIGFGRACNLGLNQVWGQDNQAWVWLINPDARIDPKADRYIEDCFRENPSIAILGTQIRDVYGNPWFMTGMFNPWTGYLNHGYAIPKDAPSQTKTFSCPWVSGCSLIVNLSQFRNCPGFDPNYFLYAEDADLCVRYADQGYTIAITNQILVTHHTSSIIGRNIEFLFYNYTYSRLYFLKQHGTILGVFLYYGYSLAKVLSLLPFSRKNALGRWRGLVAFTKHLNRISSASAVKLEIDG